MNLLSVVPVVGDIIDKMIPDKDKAAEIKLELAKLDAQESIEQKKVLASMLGNKSLFVAGAIPALIWVGVAAIANNYILLPYFPSLQTVALPGEYWSLLGTVIMGLLGKKLFDGNEIKWGNFHSPKK